MPHKIKNQKKKKIEKLRSILQRYAIKEEIHNLVQVNLPIIICLTTFLEILKLLLIKSINLIVPTKVY